MIAFAPQANEPLHSITQNPKGLTTPRFESCFNPKIRPISPPNHQTFIGFILYTTRLSPLLLVGRNLGLYLVIPILGFVNLLKKKCWRNSHPTYPTHPNSNFPPKGNTRRSTNKCTCMYVYIYIYIFIYIYIICMYIYICIHL